MYKPGLMNKENQRGLQLFRSDVNKNRIMASVSNHFKSPVVQKYLEQNLSRMMDIFAGEKESDFMYSDPIGEVCAEGVARELSEQFVDFLSEIIMERLQPQEAIMTAVGDGVTTGRTNVLCADLRGKCASGGQPWRDINEDDLTRETRYQQGSVATGAAGCGFKYENDANVSFKQGLFARGMLRGNNRTRITYTDGEYARDADRILESWKYPARQTALRDDPKGARRLDVDPYNPPLGYCRDPLDCNKTIGSGYTAGWDRNQNVKNYPSRECFTSADGVVQASDSVVQPSACKTASMDGVVPFHQSYKMNRDVRKESTGWTGEQYARARPGSGRDYYKSGANGIRGVANSDFYGTVNQQMYPAVQWSAHHTYQGTEDTLTDIRPEDAENTSNHYEMFSDDLKAVNGDNVKLWTDGDGWVDQTNPAAMKRLLTTASSRSAYAPEDRTMAGLQSAVLAGELSENNIPWYRKALHRRNHDRDLDETLGGDEYGNIQYAHDMGSLYCRMRRGPPRNC